MFMNQISTRVPGSTTRVGRDIEKVRDAAQLRDKLELDPIRPRHFVTETGVGYRLVLED